MFGIFPPGPDDNFSESTYESSVNIILESFLCFKCFKNCKPKTGVIVRNCLHHFCINCLKTIINNRNESKIKCPYEGKYHICDNFIIIEDFKILINEAPPIQYIPREKLKESESKELFHENDNNILSALKTKHDSQPNKSLSTNVNNSLPLSESKLDKWDFLKDSILQLYEKNEPSSQQCNDGVKNADIKFETINEQTNSTINQWICCYCKQQNDSLDYICELCSHENLQYLNKASEERFISEKVMSSNNPLINFPKSIPPIEINPNLVMPFITENNNFPSLIENLAYCKSANDPLPINQPQYGCAATVNDTNASYNVIWNCKTCSQVNDITSPFCIRCNGKNSTNIVYYENVVESPNILQNNDIQYIWLCEYCKKLNSIEIQICVCGYICAQDFSNIGVTQEIESNETIPSTEVTEEQIISVREQTIPKQTIPQRIAAAKPETVPCDVATFKCPICQKDFSMDFAIEIKKCLHLFCTECFKAYLNRNGVFKPLCPYKGKKNSCSNIIEDDEIRELIVSLNYQTLTDDKYVKNEYELFCQTKNCEGRIFFSGYMDSFICSICKMINKVNSQAIKNNVETSWNCPSCTFINVTLNVRCTMCDTPKDGPSNDANLIQQSVIQEKKREDMKCSICREILTLETVVKLKKCSHSFCKTCLNKIVSYSKKSKITCPYILAYGICNKEIERDDLKYIINPEIYDDYLARIANAPEQDNFKIFYCKTPNCEGYEYCDRATNDFDCSICNKNNCLVCEVVHEGETCVEYLRQKEEDAQIPEIWNCGACTFSNNPQNPKCEVCEINNPYYREKSGKTLTYLELLTLQEEALVSNEEKFNCPICLDDCEPHQGVVLQDCFHSICKECLQDHIQHATTPVVKCPSCESHIQDREIKASVDEAAYQDHLTKSLNYAENNSKDKFHCKTPDCAYWCFYQDDVNQFICPLCGKDNCVNCQVIHEGKNCQEYQDDLRNNENEQHNIKKLEELVKTGAALKCKCGIIIIEKTGCDWVQCPICLTELCWATKGMRWGPNGRGDNSGGCLCGVNGKKCTPNCGNCH